MTWHYIAVRDGFLLFAPLMLGGTAAASPAAGWLWCRLVPTVSQQLLLVPLPVPLLFGLPLIVEMLAPG